MKSWVLLAVADEIDEALAGPSLNGVAVGTPVARLGVRSALHQSGFPLAGPLPSTAFAAGSPALFGGFPGTTGPSDFPRPFITGVSP